MTTTNTGGAEGEYCNHLDVFFEGGTRAAKCLQCGATGETSMYTSEIVWSAPRAEEDALLAALRERDAAREALKIAADALNRATEDIRHWGEYAPEYFQEKWNLTGNVTAMKDAAAAARLLASPATAPEQATPPNQEQR